MKGKTKRKLVLLAIDALLVAAILADFGSKDKAGEEIVDDAACE